MHWTEWAALTALVGAVGVAVYAAMARVMRRAVAEKQRETDRQLSAMAATVSALQARVAELGSLRAKQGEGAAFSEKADAVTPPEKSEAPEAETVAVLTAAAATFLGNKVRVRSARILPAEQGAGTWAQQGRANVQTSHNPRARG